MWMDYYNFGDVVCFDTTYRTNRDYMSFAPIIGLNNHKETIFLGAASYMMKLSSLSHTNKIAQIIYMSYTVYTNRKWWKF